MSDVNGAVKKRQAGTANCPALSPDLSVLKLYSTIRAQNVITVYISDLAVSELLSYITVPYSSGLYGSVNSS